ncbi:MAG TPA: flagellar biosynthesis anti-sigma factor FlgM [Terriglobales bacterium]|nr:flagellar biosynthesis anti-sigma factor FlgM [Terriglobales bacterium]
MRIDLNPRLADVSETGSRVKPRSEAGNSRASEASQDMARLSTHQRVQRLESQANHMPAIREDKVAALRQKIADGTYQTTAEQVAEAMFSEIVSMSAKNRP